MGKSFIILLSTTSSSTNRATKLFSKSRFKSILVMPCVLSANLTPLMTSFGGRHHRTKCVWQTFCTTQEKRFSMEESIGCALMAYPYQTVVRPTHSATWRVLATLVAALDFLTRSILAPPLVISFLLKSLQIPSTRSPLITRRESFSVSPRLSFGCLFALSSPVVLLVQTGWSFPCSLSDFIFIFEILVVRNILFVL